jgi:ABC-2 type transport system ATP-binding protein
MTDDLLNLVDLGHKKEEFVDTLSRGMKQRLCLARTLAHDPLVLILDEPASGLDPRARIEMRELLRELKTMGKTIFFSSHILSEVADICTDIAILEAGHLVAYGNMAEMRKRLRPHRIICVRSLSELNDVEEVLSGFDTVSNISSWPDEGLPEGTVKFNFSGNDEDLSQLLAKLVSQGVSVVSFSEEQGDLEDVFMQVTKGIIG